MTIKIITYQTFMFFFNLKRLKINDLQTVHIYHYHFIVCVLGGGGVENYFLIMLSFLIEANFSLFIRNLFGTTK